MEDSILVNCMIRILSKDEETYRHCLRLVIMAKAMGGHLGFNEEQTRKLSIGCCLHDLGKVLIPDRILQKTSSLTAIEWEMMKRHPHLGAMLLDVEGGIDEEIIEIVKYHHERLDGKGYPYGLQGSEIPMYSKICSIMDAYDCMVSERVYRKGLTSLQASQELLKQSGTQFDEFYVREFLNISYQFDITVDVAHKVVHYVR